MGLVSQIQLWATYPCSFHQSNVPSCSMYSFHLPHFDYYVVSYPAVLRCFGCQHSVGFIAFPGPTAGRAIISSPSTGFLRNFILSIPLVAFASLAVTTPHPLPLRLRHPVHPPVSPPPLTPPLAAAVVAVPPGGDFGGVLGDFLKSNSLIQ